MATWAIVLAAGQGRRFGRLKQFERVGGRRLVDRVVDVARRTCDRVALVLPPGLGWDGPAVDALAVGGDHQSESVRAALAAIPESAGIAVICDAAHPLASPALFTAVIGQVRAGAEAAVPIIPILEVVQRVADDVVVETLPKDGCFLTQTPQAFRLDVLRAVHADEPRPVENSSLVAERGHRVVTVPGDPLNLHVSTPRELAMADLLATSADGFPTDRRD